jgi:hypothetical protein
LAFSPESAFGLALDDSPCSGVATAGLIPFSAPGGESI